MDTKDKTSRSSSKENLNESSRPLLDEEGGTVAIELNRTDDTTTGAGEEAVKESTLEKSEEAKADGKGSESKKDKKEKKKKEKKEEKEKASKRRSSFAAKLTAGLNLLDRDDRNVNDHINITFEDVLAEPDSGHSFVCVWQNSFILFDVVKFWFYRILSAILFIPFALIWGLFFAILTSVNVWIISPLLRIFDVVLFIVHRIWSGLIKTFLDPLFKSVGQICSNVQIAKRHTQMEA
ncbi:caveolin-3-like [Argiope bruennichi]|uniref:Caveolin n=1 Tax=Argiope bruennichi TaxID=94029 RepID=A0A8T0FJK5_ARGBR|nr:caveolin-3-like [Argiope bruennichi]KAF8791116.1 Caveolin-1 like protein [Argiope bruennichi]